MACSSWAEVLRCYSALSALLKVAGSEVEKLRRNSQPESTICDERPCEVNLMVVVEQCFGGTPGTTLTVRDVSISSSNPRLAHILLGPPAPRLRGYHGRSSSCYGGIHGFDRG